MDIMALSSRIGMRGNRLILPRKLLIWVMVFLLQILFIGSYWLMPNSIDENINFDVLIANPKLEQQMVSSNLNDLKQGKIDFITKASSSSNWQRVKGAAALPTVIIASGPFKFPKNPTKFTYSKQKIKLKNINHYEDDFVVKHLNINQTEEEIALGIWNGTINNHWCFIEGSEERRFNDDDDVFAFNQCKCKNGWHGRDCGQPEVIWRALMTSKRQPFQMKSFQNIDKRKLLRLEPPNKLIAFIEGSFLNLDILELQLASIVKVVDYFMLFLKTNSEIQKTYDFKSLHKRLETILKDNQRYELYTCNHFINFKADIKKNHTNSNSNSNTKCTTQKAFQIMHQRLDNVKPSDLILHLSEQTIISTAALKFLKYYADNIDLIRFRLKYNVYGYFWQHKKQTHLNGLLSSFIHLDNQQGDFDKLYKRAYSGNSLALIIGDLNHFGGWYCEYCLQPNEIILELHIINASSCNQQQTSQSSQQQFHQQNEHQQHQRTFNEEKQVNFPNITKTHNIIDMDYIQKLISDGIYMDGNSKLLKIRNNQDKYYAPAYAQEHSWKYGSFLVNLYESLDSDDDENDIIGSYN